MSTAGSPPVPPGDSARGIAAAVRSGTRTAVDVVEELSLIHI